DRISGKPFFHLQTCNKLVDQLLIVHEHLHLRANTFFAEPRGWSVDTAPVEGNDQFSQNREV
ncbi:MAG: hypothetical protein ACKOB4_16715, partial [Acidobacteriota bacterium]